MKLHAMEKQTESQPIEEVLIKSEVIEISDEEVDTKPKKKKRIRKRLPPKVRQPCDQCTKTFGTRAELTKHMRTHTGERPYMCNVCGKTYKLDCHLSVHQLSHKGIKKFKCADCGAAFYRKVELVRHEMVHLGIKPHVCEICSKSFTQKNNLVMHVKMHNGDRPHACEVCNKRFITRSKLKIHFKRHERKKVKWEMNVRIERVQGAVEAGNSGSNAP